MTTSAKRVNIFLKKFLSQQEFDENLLKFLNQLNIDNFKEVYGNNGLFTPVASQVNFFTSATPDKFSIFTPLRGTDGTGRLLELDAAEGTDIQFQNALGVDYFVGLRFNYLQVGTQINVRTGKQKYVFSEERIGELGEPDSVVDDGDETLTIIVDSVYEAGVSHAGRKVIVYLKDAVSDSAAFEEVTVTWDGSNNRILTTTALGQTIASGISTDATEYQVFAVGPTVRRNTDLSIDPSILFIGKVQGKGAGNTPDIFNVVGVNQHFSASTQQILDSTFSFLSGGGVITWNLNTKTLSWDQALKLILPHRPYDFTINATSISNMLDGDVLYFTKDNSGGVKALIKVANGDVPNDPLSEPIALRSGDNIYFKDGAVELLGGSSEVQGRIDGITQDILTYIGALNEGDADPSYSNTDILSQGASLTTSLGVIDAFLSLLRNAVTQNQNLRLDKGGVWGPVVATGATVDEVQKLDFSAVPDAGDFTLTHSGNTTGALLFGDNAATIQAALNGLASLSTVVVAGAFPNFTVTYTGADGAVNQPLLIEATNTLTIQQNVTPTPTVVVEGDANTDEIQKVVFDFVPSSGNFTLDYGGGNETANIPYNTTAANIATEINALAIFSEVVVSGNANDGFIITFVGADGQASQPDAAIGSEDLEATLVVTLAISTQTNGSADVYNLPFASDAFVSVPSVQQARNRIDQAASSPIAFPHDGAVAYIEVNRDAGADDARPVLIKDMSEIDLLNQDIIIIARREDNEIIVGNNSMRLIVGESRKIDAGMSLENLAAIGFTSTAQFDNDWSGEGAPERFLDASDSMIEAIANLEIELDKLSGQLQIIPHESDVTKARITGVDKIMRDGTVLSKSIDQKFMKFEGAVIRLATGAIFESDDATPLGINFTPFAVPLTQFFWYQFALQAKTENADNTISIEIVTVLASGANAAAASAPFPDLNGSSDVGAIQVFNNAGVIELFEVRQLQEGGGGQGLGKPEEFTLNNSGATEDLTDLILDKTKFRSATYLIDIKRKSDTPAEAKRELGWLFVVFDIENDVWLQPRRATDFDNAGIVFTIDAGTGQLESTGTVLLGASPESKVTITEVKLIDL